MCEYVIDFQYNGSLYIIELERSHTLIQRPGFHPHMTRHADRAGRLHKRAATARALYTKLTTQAARKNTLPPSPMTRTRYVALSLLGHSKRKITTECAPVAGSRKKCGAQPFLGLTLQETE